MASSALKITALCVAPFAFAGFLGAYNIWFAGVPADPTPTTTLPLRHIIEQADPNEAPAVRW